MFVIETYCSILFLHFPYLNETFTFLLFFLDQNGTFRFVVKNCNGTVSYNLLIFYIETEQFRTIQNLCTNLKFFLFALGIGDVETELFYLAEIYHRRNKTFSLGFKFLVSE